MDVGIDTSKRPATMRTEALSNDPNRFQPRGLMGVIFAAFTSRKAGIEGSSRPATDGFLRSCTRLDLRPLACSAALRAAAGPRRYGCSLVSFIADACYRPLSVVRGASRE